MKDGHFTQPNRIYLMFALFAFSRLIMKYILLKYEVYFYNYKGKKVDVLRSVSLFLQKMN